MAVNQPDKKLKTLRFNTQIYSQTVHDISSVLQIYECAFVQDPPHPFKKQKQNKNASTNTNEKI